MVPLLPALTSAEREERATALRAEDDEARVRRVVFDCDFSALPVRLEAP